MVLRRHPRREFKPTKGDKVVLSQPEIEATRRKIAERRARLERAMREQAVAKVREWCKHHVDGRPVEPMIDVDGNPVKLTQAEILGTKGLRDLREIQKAVTA